MNLIETYPMITPGLWIILALTIFLSYHCFRGKKYNLLMVSGLFQIILSPLFAFSIGPLIFAIGVTQFYMGIVNSNKMNTVRQE